MKITANPILKKGFVVLGGGGGLAVNRTNFNDNNPGEVQGLSARAL